MQGDAINVPVPQRELVIGKEVDVTVHFREGQFLAFNDYIEKLGRLGYEVELEGSSYSIHDYPLAKAKTDGLKITVFGPNFPEPTPKPHQPSVMDKLTKAMIAEGSMTKGDK